MTRPWSIEEQTIWVETMDLALNNKVLSCYRLLLLLVVCLLTFIYPVTPGNFVEKHPHYIWLWRTKNGQKAVDTSHTSRSYVYKFISIQNSGLHKKQNSMLILACFERSFPPKKVWEERKHSKWVNKAHHIYTIGYETNNIVLKIYVLELNAI